MSASSPTIPYGTSSTELFSFLESGKKEAGEADVGEGSVLVSVWRLLPPDVLLGGDVAVMMSSGSADVVVVGNSGTADVLTGSRVTLRPSSVTTGAAAGSTVGVLELHSKKRGGAVFLSGPVVVVEATVVPGVAVTVAVGIISAVSPEAPS